MTVERKTAGKTIQGRVAQIPKIWPAWEKPGRAGTIIFRRRLGYNRSYQDTSVIRLRNSFSEDQLMYRQKVNETDIRKSVSLR